MKSLEKEVNKLKDLLGIDHKLVMGRDIVCFGSGYLMVKPEYETLSHLVHAYFGSAVKDFEKQDRISPPARSNYTIVFDPSGHYSPCFHCEVHDLHVVKLKIGYYRDAHCNLQNLNKKDFRVFTHLKESALSIY